MLLVPNSDSKGHLRTNYEMVALKLPPIVSKCHESAFNAQIDRKLKFFRVVVVKKSNIEGRV